MLLSRKHLDTVVAIEVQQEDSTFKCIATGFLCGFLTGKKNEKGENLYRIFLVTNRHVFNKKTLVYLRFNFQEEARRYPLPLTLPNGDINWEAHIDEKIDLAVTPINANKLKEEGVTYSFVNEENMAFMRTIDEEGISQGDGVFVLGYPMGKAGLNKNYAIVRGGIIARLDNEIIAEEHGFLIDALIFPGNSGGPVFLKPEIASIEGTKAVNNSYLLGVIKSYIPYSETAYSLQTDPPTPRIQFVENSGLAHVVPLDYVRDIVDKLMPKEKDETNEKMGTEEDSVEEAQEH